jgi:hypothetical protein
MKRGMIAMSAVMAMGMANLLMADTLTQQFEANPQYATYQKYIDNNDTTNALKLKRAILEKLVADTFAGYETSERSRNGIKKKFDSMPLQIKTIWCDLYLKSKNILVDESQRIAFNASLAFFVDSVHFGLGNAEYHAHNIASDIRFNDGGKFGYELVEVGKSADNIAQYRKQIADADKKIAEWNEVIKLLEKLGQ